MKKLLAIGGVIVVIFVLIIALNNQANKKKLTDNPYDKDDLKQATISLLGDENYSNIVMPQDLLDKVTSGESVTAYFFSPECKYCREMTPIMMPIAKEEGIDVQQFNLLEYPQEAQVFGIQSWPTLVQYKNGEEIARISGMPENTEEAVREFFDTYAKE